jgi:ATP:cob(I)alamin adenosyltransferase
VKIYTKRGDQGETDLLGGGRVSKDDMRVEAYGAVDELNACLGQCAAATAHEDLRGLTLSIQSMLFDLGGYLAAPHHARREKSGVVQPESSDIEALETHIDALEEELEPLKCFIFARWGGRGGCVSPGSHGLSSGRAARGRVVPCGTLERGITSLSKSPIRFALRDGAGRKSARGNCRYRVGGAQPLNRLSQPVAI